MLPFRGAINTKDLYGSVPALSGGATFTAQVRATAPTMYWPLNESVGASSVLDASGHGRTLTPSNVVFGADGIGDGNTGASFNGTNAAIGALAAAVDAEVAAGRFNYDAFSVMAWVKPDYWLYSGTNQTVMMLRVDGTNQVIVRHESPGDVIILREAQNTQKESTIGLQTQPQYYCILYTCDQTGDELIAYVNGTAVGSPTAGNLAWTGGNLDDTYTKIGSAGGFGQYFRGSIAHVALWGRVLTPVEIAALYAAAPAQTTLNDPVYITTADDPDGLGHTTIGGNNAVCFPGGNNAYMSIEQIDGTWSPYSLGAGGAKPEGCSFLTVDGNTCAVFLNQTDGTITLFDSGGAETTTPWSSGNIISSRPNVQDVLTLDLTGSGHDDIIYTWEGSGAGSGGVNLLVYDGSGDVTDSANWDDYALIQRDGAWGLASELVDISGSGRGDLVFTSRDFANPSADPGLFWLAQPATPTDPWPETTIDAAVRDWLHVDVGNFSPGETGRRDVLVVANGIDPTIYDFSAAWSTTAISTAPGGSTWLATTRKNASGYDGFFTAAANDYILEWSWSGSAWESSQLLTSGTHPADDRGYVVDDANSNPVLLLTDSANNARVVAIPL